MTPKTLTDQASKETDPIVEKTNQLSKDDQINPTTSDQNDEKDLKLNIEFRNQLINKLNQFNEMIFVGSVDEKNKFEILKENNQLLSILLNLPVLNLVNSVNCASEIAEVSKNVQLANHSEQTQKSDISPEQFVRQLESLIIKVKKFNPRTENIEYWFEKYRIYSTLYEWSFEEHLKALPFFFHPSIIKIIKRHGRSNGYFDVLEQELISEITRLTKSESEINSNWIKSLIDKFSFSPMEIKYWLELHRSISTFKITHPECYDIHLKNYELWYKDQAPYSRNRSHDGEDW